MTIVYSHNPEQQKEIDALKAENERLKVLINRVLEWTPAFPVEASLLDDLADAVRSPGSAADKQCNHDLQSKDKTLRYRKDLGNVWECAICNEQWGADQTAPAESVKTARFYGVMSEVLPMEVFCVTKRERHEHDTNYIDIAEDGSIVGGKIASGEPTCEWKRVGDYKYKAACKGCTFQIRSDLEDMGNCPDCKAKIKVSR